ncbi:MAG: hypothetical protein ABSF15_24775 [Candidatus Sulfotelmatobacter sp.]|jgi:hypothetical protein
MANFFFTGGPAGYNAINLDQVTHVIRDSASETATLYFERDHTIVLEGEMAKEFMDVLTRLNSEASQAVEAIKKGDRPSALNTWKKL